MDASSAYDITPTTIKLFASAIILMTGLALWYVVETVSKTVSANNEKTNELIASLVQGISQVNTRLDKIESTQLSIANAITRATSSITIAKATSPSNSESTTINCEIATDEEDDDKQYILNIIHKIRQTEPETHRPLMPVGVSTAAEEALTKVGSVADTLMSMLKGMN